MSIRQRIFLGIFLLVGVGLYFLVSWIIDDLTPQYRESTEEPLVDAARTFAAFASATADESGVNVELFRQVFDDAVSQRFNARIYKLDKTAVDWRVYITDRAGIVVFDSRNGTDEGKDYAAWRDVKRTLEGEYGARTTHETPGVPESTLYVAAPILRHGELLGVLSLGKPSRNANLFIADAKRKIVIGGMVCVFAMLVTGLGVSAMITRPIQSLTSYANAIRDGQRVTPPRFVGIEIRQLGEAFEQMRDALDGKQYVENYVQTLTHEIKSPLSAIRGAVELLQEPLPEDRREQFLRNIAVETERIQQLVEKLLLLSSLENRKSPIEFEKLSLSGLVSTVLQELNPALEAKELQVQTNLDPKAEFLGDASLIRHAIVNLIQNAIDFSSRGQTVEVSTKVDRGDVVVEVADRGPGIPSYAEDRIFEKFYSLKRPDTGKKSSGLGLSLVQEVAGLHQGRVTLTNRTPAPGARAELRLPRIIRT